MGPVAAESVGARVARSRSAVGGSASRRRSESSVVLGRCFPALAMAPAEVLSGKIVSAYVPSGARPSFPPRARHCVGPGLLWVGRPCGELRGFLPLGVAEIEKEPGVAVGAGGQQWNGPGVAFALALLG